MTTAHGFSKQFAGGFGVPLYHYSSKIVKKKKIKVSSFKTVQVVQVVQSSNHILYKGFLGVWP